MDYDSIFAQETTSKIIADNVISLSSSLIALGRGPITSLAIQAVRLRLIINSEGTDKLQMTTIKPGDKASFPQI